MRTIARLRETLLATAFAAVACLAASTPVAADAPSGPPPGSVCIDTSSPTAALDRRVANAANPGTIVYAYDGTYGVSEKLFRFLVREHCELLMGYPVDAIEPDPPSGLLLTRRYYRTGYVLASLGRPTTVRRIPARSSVGVGLGTVPNFYLVGALGTAPGFKADAYQSQEEALDALVKRTDAAAMLWEPSVQRYRESHATGPRIAIAPLPIQHDSWALAALYDPKRSSDAARRFERAVARLATTGRLAVLTNSSASEFPQ